MKTRTLIAALAATTLVAGSASAAVVSSYSAGVSATAGTAGAADPTSQGWVANAGTGTTAFSHGLDSSNGGWRITDGTSGAPFFYQDDLSGAEATDLGTNDWTATWTVAVNADAVNSGGGGVDDFYAAGGAGAQNDNAAWIETTGGTGFRYILTYNVDANNDIQLTDGTTTYQITTANNQLSHELGAGSPSATFVTVTLSSVGGVVTLSDSVNGAHATAVSTSGAAGVDRVVFGATSSGGLGSTTWNNFSVTTVPEPGSLALMGLGGLMIARRRRA